jgi:hypothetical protein
MKKSYRLDGSPQTQKAMMAELAAKEVAGNVVAIYLGDSGQARNAAKAPANRVETFPDKPHELRLTQSEHPHLGHHPVHEPDPG